ncbi:MULTISPECIES: hypothetical protein [Nostocales]|uniref:Lipoprotein n=3 Tax=Nostocales TaxID=1161 RepID=A0A0C1NBA6_9CYAN|nr:hypothetical protein [Tolypothrix bouteillei]KAF3890669.1 hypothetical protein DA73_0400038420 [Tolypothrix bouteillei VB521301]
MRKFSAISATFVFLTLAFNVLPTHAQSNSSCTAQARIGPDATNKILALGRAKNVARQAAEAANGGIENYRAENSMHGPIEQVPCVDNGDGTWTFTFKGTAPGGTTPIVESVVTVNSQTFEVKVDRNTPLSSVDKNQQ